MIVCELNKRVPLLEKKLFVSNASNMPETNPLQQNKMTSSESSGNSNLAVTSEKHDDFLQTEGTAESPKKDEYPHGMSLVMIVAALVLSMFMVSNSVFLVPSLFH